MRRNIYFLIYYLYLGRQPVAGVITCYISTDYEDFTVKFMYGGLHEKHFWSVRYRANTGDVNSNFQ